MNIKYISKGIALLALCLIFNQESRANILVSTVDSIGVEISNGKQVISHRLEAKESYYSLSRKYNLRPKEISDFNKNKALKVGDIVKIPTNRSASVAPQVVASPKPSSSAKPAPTPKIENTNTPQAENSTQYKIGAGETLYSIAKRFQTSVPQIVKFNNLKNEQDIKVNQVINIPQGGNRAPVIVPEEEPEEPIETEIAEERKTPLPANRYGLTQIDEKGIGVWMEGLNADGGNMLALHKTAPVGTVIKITNPMTHKTTFAKVVGKYNDNSNTRDAVIVISKSTANLLGILDKRFLINISYGMSN